MLRLTEEQISKKLDFIKQYISAKNSADGSTFDANANVSSKNIATLSAELNKDINIQINRALIKDKINTLFGSATADTYTKYLENHDIYVHDETSILPYCVSISMYPFLLEGLQGFGGEAKAPKHLSSFNGGFINLIFAVSSQFAGAVATAEYLMCFDYFARKDYGENYLKTHRKVIQQELQSTVYALNQPAASRNYQSTFWNISIYDKYYFKSMFEHFYFPDGTKPNWETFKELQTFFMQWFNQERTKALLTFPVVTAACINDGETLKDKEFEELLTNELSEGNSFFIFTSPSAYALSSCCRLKNDISDQVNDFSYSLGAGGVMTGSLNVITINLAKLARNSSSKGEFHSNLETMLQDLYKFQIAFKTLYKEYLSNDLLPAYSANFINLDKQYLTIGINGLVEASEHFGYEINYNKEYLDFVSSTLKLISDANKVASKQYKVKLNTEFVPAESLGVKFAKWDAIEFGTSPRKCYNSYLYRVEDDLDLVSKFILHGKESSEFLDGGSALHVNLENYATKETYKKLLDLACKVGCEYFCFNTKITICENCGNIDKRTLYNCPTCHSDNISHATRVIGYLKKVKDFSSERQLEESKRFYHKC